MYSNNGLENLEFLSLCYLFIPEPYTKGFPASGVSITAF